MGDFQNVSRLKLFPRYHMSSRVHKTIVLLSDLKKHAINKFLIKYICILNS